MYIVFSYIKEITINSFFAHKLKLEHNENIRSLIATNVDVGCLFHSWNFKIIEILRRFNFLNYNKRQLHCRAASFNTNDFLAANDGRRNTWSLQSPSLLEYNRPPPVKLQDHNSAEELLKSSPDDHCVILSKVDEAL